MTESTDEQHPSQNDSQGAEQTHKIFGLEVIVVALLLFIAGLGFIAVGALVPAENSLLAEIVHHLLRDVGIAAIISALLGSAYEYQLRSDFLDDAEHALGLAVQ